jgi:Ca-activated chloride channel homolog
MLKLELKRHRAHALAERADQTLYVLAKLTPTKGAPLTARVGLAVVVDSSGSMRERVGGSEQTKIDKVIDALGHLGGMPALDATDEIYLIKFDTDAKAIFAAPLADRRAYAKAVPTLRDYAGGTQMATGLTLAQERLARSDCPLRKLMLFTDGEVFDAGEVQTRCLPALYQAKLPVIAMGVGDSYNHELLALIADKTTGGLYHLGGIEDLKAGMARHVIAAKHESVQDVEAVFKLHDGFAIRAIRRIRPSIAHVEKRGDAYYFGNLSSREESVFVIELALASRPVGTWRALALELAYTADGQRRALADAVLLDFTGDPALATEVDSDVMFFVKQWRVQEKLDEAQRAAAADKPDVAAAVLREAQRMTRQVGNGVLAETVDLALRDLGRTGGISPYTRRLLTSRGRTETVAASEGRNGPPGLSAEMIKAITGT